MVFVKEAASPTSTFVRGCRFVLNGIILPFLLKWSLPNMPIEFQKRFGAVNLSQGVGMGNIFAAA
jgi:hypothetical protein